MPWSQHESFRVPPRARRSPWRVAAPQPSPSPAGGRRLRRGFLPNQARPAIGIMGPMGSGGGGGGATGCSDVLVADGLRAAVFFRVVAFLAAGFLRAAVFFRTAAFAAAVFFRPAGLRTATVFFRAAVFLRVALLVRAAALVLLAGIAITFPIVGDNRIHTIGGAVRCPERGERIRTPSSDTTALPIASRSESPSAGPLIIQPQLHRAPALRPTP